MKYFNCKWLKELPKDVYVRTNMCLNLSTITQYSPTNQAVIEKTERQDKVSKQIPDQIDKEIDKMLPTPYLSTFHSVTEMSDRDVSNQITEQIDKMISTPDHSNILSTYIEEFALETSTYSEYQRPKSSKSKYKYFWWIWWIWMRSLLMYYGYNINYFHHIPMQKEVPQKNRTSGHGGYG